MATSQPQALALALALASGCDPPPTVSLDSAPRTSPRSVISQDAAAPQDRVIVRKAISYYRWMHTDLPTSGGDGQGIDHGTIHLSLIVEVHRNPLHEGWLSVGALGAQVAIAQNPHLRAVGSTLTFSLPESGHNDPRMEIFGGDVRSDEALRAYLSTRPEESVQLVLGNTPSFVRLPAQSTLPAASGWVLGQYDTFLVVVIPMRNRRGGRYLVQVLDMNAEPGGFSQNGVMNHPPTRAEIQRLTHWMRDPQGAARNRPPPLAMHPIDRS